MWSLFGESVIHHQFKSMVVHWDSVKMNYVVVNSYAFRIQLLFMKTNDWILTSCHKQCIFFLQPFLCPEGLQDRGWSSQYSLAILYFSHNSFIVPDKMLSHISLKILQAKHSYKATHFSCENHNLFAEFNQFIQRVYHRIIKYPELLHLCCPPLAVL